MTAPAPDLASVWRTTVAADPTAIAVVEAATGRIITRGALDTEAAGIRAQLPPSLRHRRVVLSAPNNAAWLAWFLALADAGAVIAPINPDETPTHQANLAHAIGAAASCRDGQLTLLPPSQIPPDRHAAVIKFTSGSTGPPRALRFTAAQMLADGRQVAASMGITPADRNLAAIPFGHSYGLGNLVLPLLTQGTAIVIAGAPLPRVLAEDAARWSATVFPTVPAIIRLFNLSLLPPDPLSTVHTVISAGSPLPVEIARAFTLKTGHRIHNFYGSSETGGISYDRTGETPLTDTGVGTALDGVQLDLLPSGRLQVTSAAVMTLGNRRRHPTGVGQLLMADRATLAADGTLSLHGRTGRTIKLAGRRLELGELEHQLRALPDIDDAFVLPHPHRPDDLSAALQTRLTKTALRHLLGQNFPAWKIPRRLIALPAFPLTPRGKTDAAALRRLLHL